LRVKNSLQDAWRELIFQRAPTAKLAQSVRQRACWLHFQNAARGDYAAEEANTETIVSMYD